MTAIILTICAILFQAISLPLAMSMQDTVEIPEKKNVTGCAFLAWLVCSILSMACIWAAGR